MAYIQADDGTQLYYKDWGSGRPVVLIHGWPLSADSWDHAAMELAEAGFRSIAYDRRGFGRSEQPWGGYDYDTLADDLAAVLRETQSTDAAIVGFSMGGGEVARYMSRHGGQGVAKAVLISSVVPYMLKTPNNAEGVDQDVFDQMTEAIREERPKFMAQFFRNFFGVGLLTHPVSDELLEWSRGVAMDASLRATLECAKAFATTDFRPDLPHFKVPTLIIHGTGDTTVPINASGRAAANGIAGSQLIEYEGAPHGLFATHKERLADDLVSFLSRS